MTIRIARKLGACLGVLAFAALPLRGVAAEAAPAAPEQVIVLQHTTPADIIKLMHWDDRAQVPGGVQSITADNGKNTLKVVANADGLATVKDLVKDIDVPVRQIRIEIHEFLALQKDIDRCGITFATPLEPGQTMGEAVRAASRHEQVMTALGKSATNMLALMTVSGKKIGAPSITTTNNVLGMLKISSATGLDGLPAIEAISIGVTPRANSDNTVTLPIKVEMDPVIVGVPRDPAPPKVVEALQTVRDGETLVLVNVASAGTGDAARQLLIFVTPHLLATQ